MTNSIDAREATRPATTPGSNTPEARAASSASDSAIKDPGKLRILVVDDEPTIRSVIGQVLRFDGHEPTEVGSAEEALAAFRAQPFPLVITDIIMGRMNGIQLLREIKQADAEILVVIMTSQASLETAMTALREGAYDFLVKPFDDLIMISALVERATEKLRLQNRNKLLTHQLEMYAGELERLNLDLKQAANRDWLTGLYNRRYLRATLDSELSRAQRYNRSFSLMLLDVDHFKSFNDTHGHLAGDEVLRGVAHIMQTYSRSEDLCARYGGEEFLVLMPESNHEAALAAAERLRAAVEAHQFVGSDTQPSGAVTVSLGVATYPADGIESNTLIGRADAALYHAKALGRNRVQG